MQIILKNINPFLADSSPTGYYTSMSLLGLDVGTTGCKAAAFSAGGELLASAYREYSLLHPEPGWSELDVTNLWEAVKEVVREVNAGLKKNVGAGGRQPNGQETQDTAPAAVRDPVTALSVSCQGEAVVPVGHDGTTLYNFIVTFDGRTDPYPDWWEEREITGRGEGSREQIFTLTGMPLHPMYSVNKILWFKEHRPEIFEQTWKFLCVQDFIGWKLTGNTVIDYSLASRTMAFDISRLSWSEEILEAAGIGREMFAAPTGAGEPVGYIKRDVQEALGFDGRVLVAAGGHDQACGALGCGVDREGPGMNAMGTSEVVCPVSSEPILSSFMLEHNYACYCHAETGKYITLAVNLSGGLLLRWYRDVLCDGEVSRAEGADKDPYEVIIEEASDDIKSIYFLPHFVGSGTPHLDPRSRGAVVGLTNETAKADLTRAVLTSIAFESLIDLELLQEAGFRIEELRAIGGGSRSDRWLQLKADCFGMPVRRMQTTEAAALGAAILAGKASGAYAGCSDGIEAAVRFGKEFRPDSGRHGRYREKFGEYRLLYRTLKEFNHRITGG
jgi:xylulokinase